MADSEVSPVSDESLEMIEGPVKQGKARKFFFVYKGSSIKCLVVFKKGKFGPKVQQAKKDGFKGEICYGVLTGSGKNLFFQLAGNAAVAEAMKVDAWEESPPVAPTKIRAFLAESGLSLKPAFCIIKAVDEAPDPESESDLALPPPPAGSLIADDEDGEESSEPSGLSSSGTERSPGPIKGDDEALERFKTTRCVALAEGQTDCECYNG